MQERCKASFSVEASLARGVKPSSTTRGFHTYDLRVNMTCSALGNVSLRTR